MPDVRKRTGYKGIVWRIHGNYVGPGWSAGKYQGSVADSDVQPVDEFDKTAMEHDAAYAKKKNLKKADYKFFRDNWGKGFVRSAAALAVGAQGYLRSDSEDATLSSLSDKFGSMQIPPSPPKTPHKRRRSSAGESSMKRRRGSNAKASSSSSRSVRSTRRNRRPIGRKIQLRAKRRLRQRARKGRSSGYTGSTSRGFFKKGRRGLNTYEKYAGKGVGIVRESGSGGLISGAKNTQCVAVMHSTVGDAQIKSDVCRALVKMFFQKNGYDVVNFADKVSISAAAGGSVRLEIDYQLSLFAANSTYLFDIQNNSTTYENIVTDMVANLCNNWCPTFNFIQARLSLFKWGDATTYQFAKSINLMSCKIHMCIKSAMKLQNQTVSKTADNDRGDVNQVPLYGKSYEGNGNFMMQRTGKALPATTSSIGLYLISQTDAFRPPTASALMENGPGSTYANAWCEPPRLNEVIGPKKQAKAHLDPGEIRTSVLTYTKSFNLNSLARKVNYTTGTQSFLKIGNFRAIFLEKMLNYETGTVENAIKIAVEHDHKTGIYATASKVNATTSEVMLNTLSAP